jgi:uncharacterized repeat protein (TIGR04076 family)
LGIELVKIRITVLKKMWNEDLIKKYGKNVTPCEYFNIGDEFVLDNLEIPKGFCSWAWTDIQRDVVVLAYGGNFRMKDEGITVSCCTDGFRPVIFKLERID